MSTDYSFITSVSMRRLGEDILEMLLSVLLPPALDRAVMDREELDDLDEAGEACRQDDVRRPAGATRVACRPNFCDVL